MTTATTTTKRACAVSLSCPEDLAKMKLDLGGVNTINNNGGGPMRFAPTVPERTFEEQIHNLKFSELECYEAMIDRWELKYHPSHEISPQLILRYVRNSPSGEKPWNKKAIWKLLQMYRTNAIVRAQINLTITDTIDQLRTKTLFPVPGLKTKESSLDVVYMKPSRYSPNVTPSSVIVDNLAYCVNTMLEKEHACTHGIAFMAYMNDYTMQQNFSTEYCLKFLKLAQGRRIPVQIQQFFIVNPPRWFHKIWTIMKPMLTKEFQRKIRMIPESKLSKYLAPGYQSFLPNDMVTGKASTDGIVQDFITYRLYVEQGAIMAQQPPPQSANDESHNTAAQVSDDATLVTPTPTDSKVLKPMTSTITTKTTTLSLDDLSSTTVQKKKQNRRFWSSSIIVRPNM